MKEYNYSDIIKIHRSGIEFYDGEYINFEACRHNWAKEKCILINDTVCVAIRIQENNNRYFIFYSDEKIKINFECHGLLKNRKSRKEYFKMQMMLNKLGYTSYDNT